MRRSIRLPLQTGSVALRDAISSLWTGIIGVIGLWILVWSFQRFTTVWDTWCIWGALVGIVVVGVGFRSWMNSIMSSRGHRASDIAFDDVGVRIEGGRKDELVAPFAEIDPAKCTLEESVGTYGDGQALFVTVSGDPLLFAESTERDEAASIDAVFSVIQGKLAPHTAVPKASRDVLSCAACGAPAPLTDSPTVACAYCKVAVEIPDAIRRRILDARASGEADAVATRALERVLRQPGAARVNVLLALTTVFASLTLTAILLALWSVAARFAVAPLALLTTSAYSFTRASVGGRRALRDVLLRFGARAAPDGSYACARCSGGLPATSGAIIRCVYCGCQNAIGVDFGARINTARFGHAALEDLLAARTRVRAIYATLGVGAFVLAPIAVALPVLVMNRVFS